MATEADYLQQAQAMLPQGPAWTRSLDATLTKVLGVFAAESYKIALRSERLVREANPADTLEFYRTGNA